MDKTSSNIFSRMKLKELVNDNSIAVNKEEKVAFSEMLKDWEYLSSKIPEEEFFKMDKKKLNRKLQKLIYDYKETTESSPKVIKNQKINSLIRCNPRKSCIYTRSSDINSGNSLLITHENSIFPSIKKETYNSETKTNSILGKPSSFNANRIVKKIDHNSTEKSYNNHIFDLELSANDTSFKKDKNLDLIDNLLNNIISPKISFQINSRDHQNNGSTNMQKVKKKDKKNNYIVIKTHKYKLPANVLPNKINPSFFNILEKDNYYKYIEKFYDTTQDINIIRGINPYLKEVYNMKPPANESLKTYEMLQNEFYGAVDCKYPTIINNVLNRKPQNKENINLKKEYIGTRKKEAFNKSPIRILFTDENKNATKQSNIPLKRNHRSRNISNLCSNTTGKYINTMNSLYTLGDKDNLVNTKYFNTNNSLKNENGKSTHRKVISECDALIKEARRDFSSNLDSIARNKTIIKSTFLKAFEKSNIMKSYAKKEMRDLKKAGLFDFSKQQHQKNGNFK